MGRLACLRSQVGTPLRKEVNNLNKIKNMLIVGGLSVMTVGAVAPAAAFATANNNDNIDFCHSTGADNNPYVTIKTDPDSIISQGHTGHVGPLWTPGATTWGDIIPPFDYTGGHYNGLNWPAGQVYLANNCNIPKPTPSPTVSPTVSPTASPTPSVTPSATVSPTVSPTASPTVSPTASVTPSVTPTQTVSPTPSVTPSATVSPSESPSESPSASPSASETPVVVPTTEPPAPVPSLVAEPTALPHTGADVSALTMWSVLAIAGGGTLLVAGLRKTE